MTHYRNAVILGAALFLLTACDYLPLGYTPIQEITAAPAQFEGKEVKIKGQVSNTTKIPIIDLRFYSIKNDTAEIVVTTAAELPAMNQKIAIRGVVESAAILGGESVGLRVKEVERLPTLIN